MAKPEYKITRGEMLRMLYRQYPDPVADNVVKSTFVWVTHGVLDGHAAYLMERGYVTREDIDRAKFEFSTATYLLRLTSKGVDLLEGNIAADPGIQNPPL